MRNILHSAFCLFLLTSLAYGETVERIERQLIEEESKLSKIKKEIEQNNREILKREKKGKLLLAEIGRSNDAIEIMNRELKIYEWNLKKNNLKKKDVIEKLNVIEAVLNKKREFLGKRLRIMYKERSRSYLKAVLSADSFSSGIQRIKYMNKIARYDWQFIEDFKKRVYELKYTEHTLKKIERKINAYKQKAYTKRRQIEVKRRKKKSLLKKIQTKKGLLEKAVLELNENYKELKELIERLSNGKKDLLYTPSNFAKKRGGFSWPVYGKIISSFGRVKNKKINAYLFNNGIDIAASPGKEITSIYEGEVIYADRVNGYGRLIIIDHGEYYYSIYAHLTELSVSVGDKVGEGQTIAKVDREGFLTDIPSLYFEIRHRGKPQNPVVWLETGK